MPLLAWPRLTPSSSTLISMGCNRTAVAAFSFASRLLAAFINTTRPTLISPQTICISAKSAWSVRVPALRRSRLWATQQLLPLIKEGEFANGLDSSREAAMLLHRKNLRGRKISFSLRARARHPGVGGARGQRCCIFPPGASDLRRRRPQGSSSRSGATTLQVFSRRLVARPAPAAQRHLPAFCAHEAGASGLAGGNLEQAEPSDK